MVNLQYLDSNINPNFSGKINIEQDFYAYVDESGEEGFELEKKGVSQWFNVSALITTPKISSDMMDYIGVYNKKRCLHKPVERMSIKDLKHTQRKDLLLGLSAYKFITTHSLFYKPKIDPTDRLVTYPSMYFVGIKNVIERISWCTQQCGMNRAHILISNRNSISTEQLKNYLFNISFRANANMTYKNRIGIVRLSTINLHSKLLLADYSAFSLRMAFEMTGDPPCNEPYYFDWFQKGKLFSSTHKKYSGVWGNGLKLTPSDRSLIIKSDILNEGSHKF